MCHKYGDGQWFIKMVLFFCGCFAVFWGKMATFVAGNFLFHNY
jgi:hypothetical protein